MNLEVLYQELIDYLHTIFPASDKSVAPPGRPSWLTEPEGDEAVGTPPGPTAPADPWAPPQSASAEAPTGHETVPEGAGPEHETAPVTAVPTHDEVVHANTVTPTGTVAV